MAEDEASKLHKTRLSFPSDFSTRAHALKEGKKSDHSRQKPKLSMLYSLNKQNSEHRDKVKSGSKLRLNQSRDQSLS